MNYLMKVSLPGKDVSSSNPTDFVMGSDYSSAVIYKEDSINVTISGSSSTKSTINFYELDGTTPFTFPYIPVVYIMSQLTPSGPYFQSPFTFTTGDTDPIWIDPTPANTAVTDSNFFITFVNQTATSRTINYHYYIYANLST